MYTYLALVNHDGFSILDYHEEENLQVWISKDT